MNTLFRYTRPVATLLENLLAGVTEYTRRRAAIRELSALPDWQLQDIGIFRGDIAFVVNKLLAEKAVATKTAAVAAKTETIREESYVARTEATA